MNNLVLKEQLADILHLLKNGIQYQDFQELRQASSLLGRLYSFIDENKSPEELQRTLDWFKEAKPNPISKDLAVQVGCHLEEVAEMLNVFNPMLGEYIDVYAQSYKEWKTLDNIDWTDYKLIELLDALCDQIVTAIGVAHMFGFDIKKALAEVNKSNWSKFENGKPVFYKNGKIKKGKYYKEPELEMFINK